MRAIHIKTALQHNSLPIRLGKSQKFGNVFYGQNFKKAKFCICDSYTIGDGETSLEDKELTVLHNTNTHAL